MKQTIMAYMVATIVSFAVIGGLTMQPLSSMAQREDQVQQGDQIQNPDNIIQRQDQADGSSTSSNIRTSSDSGRSSDSRTPTTTATCGQMVEGLVELNSNLMCSGDGLIVGADRTTIRLNGHTIMGPGPDSSKVGISIGNHDGVTIEGPGTVEQWQAGVLASGAAGTTVTSTVLRDNQIAMFTTGTDSFHARQNLINNNQIGVAAHTSNGLDLRENLLSGNQLAGVTLVATGDSSVSTNNILESQNGVFADTQSSNNRIDSNNVLRNTVDLNNGNGLPINVNHNTYTNNNCEISKPSGLCIGR